MLELDLERLTCNPRLSNRTNRPGHRSQPLRKLIPPRRRDHQSFLRPGHTDVEEFHVLGDRGFRGINLAETNEDHGAEFESLAALHGEDVGIKFASLQCSVFRGEEQ